MPLIIDIGIPQHGKYTIGAKSLDMLTAIFSRQANKHSVMSQTVPINAVLPLIQIRLIPACSPVVLRKVYNIQQMVVVFYRLPPSYK